ncbi:MAG: type VI secretion system baseplate subunit TssK [Alphaproteobacteria bacterium]|nr:type VI secretion system baseplate subunit TssK [Alphaproteobacteria bacterium]
MKVLWTEGMFLTPHHLQAFERQVAAERDARVDALPCATWGVLDVELDPGRLAAGVVRLRAIDVVLPDGTRLAWGPDDPILERALPDGGATTSGPVRVHLAVPADRARGLVLCTDDAPVATARYAVDEAVVHDTLGDGDARTLQVGRLRPALHLDREPGEGFVRLTVAEVVRDAHGAWTLSPTFVPRRLRASTDPVLRRRVDDGIARLHARRAHLAAELAATDAGDATGATMLALVTLSTLGSGIAHLEHVRHLDGADPERWFDALLGLAGGLLAVRPGLQASLPTWRPDDAYGAFHEVLTAIDAALDARVARAHVPVSLALHEGVWRADLPTTLRTATADWYLLLRGDAPDQPLSEDARRAIKVAAPDEIDRIVRMKLVGVTLSELADPPRGAPRRTDVRYLGLRASGLTWRRIADEGAIAVHLPASLQAREVELVAVP